MDHKALEIVGEYINEHLDRTDVVLPFEMFIVWKCKTLQNWKWLISTTLPDGMYYEVTYNGDKKEFYLQDREYERSAASKSAQDALALIQGMRKSRKMRRVLLLLRHSPPPEAAPEKAEAR